MLHREFRARVGGPPITHKQLHLSSTFMKWNGTEFFFCTNYWNLRNSGATTQLLTLHTIHSLLSFHWHCMRLLLPWQTSAHYRLLLPLVKNKPGRVHLKKNWHWTLSGERTFTLLIKDAAFAMQPVSSFAISCSISLVFRFSCITDAFWEGWSCSKMSGCETGSPSVWQGYSNHFIAGRHPNRREQHRALQSFAMLNTCTHNETKRNMMEDWNCKRSNSKD